MSHIVAVLNQKGGVGKTTTSINLATYLAKQKQSVLLIDLDPQGNATSGLGVDKQQLTKSTYDVVVGNVPLDDAVLIGAYPGLSLLPANANLAGAEIDLVSKVNREHRLKSALLDCKESIVIIDCPPALGLLTVNALTAADSVLIPVQTEYYAMEGLSQLLSVIQRVKEGLNPQLQILGAVMTMYDKRTTLSDQVANELKNFFGDKLFGTIIPRNVRLAEAPSHGKPVADYDKWSKGARAYKQLAKEFLDRINTHQ